jgi:hypothetical protein
MSVQNRQEEYEYRHRGFEPLWPLPMQIDEKDDKAGSIATNEFNAKEVSDSYARGLADGIASAEMTLSVEINRLRKMHEHELHEIRHSVTRDRAETIAAAIESEISELEVRLRQSIVNVLGPVIARCTKKRETEHLAETASKIVELQGKSRIVINGPKEWASQIAEALSTRNCEVDVIETESSEINIRIDEAEIYSALPRFVREIEELLDE